MHQSCSEDILQRIKVRKMHNATMSNISKDNDPSRTDKTYSWRSNHPSPNTLSKIHETALSPLLQRPISYNECINQNQSRSGGRYKLRNCRQPQLKIIETAETFKQKARVTSYLGLKELMKKQVDRCSLKKKYDQVMEQNGDIEMIQKLRNQLLFLPNSVKLPHKNRYRPNKKQPPLPGAKIVINGNKLQDKSEKLKKQLSDQELYDFPEHNRRTSGFQIKYRRNYLNKSLPYDPKSKYLNKEKEEQFEQDPLTGWS